LSATEIAVAIFALGIIFSLERHKCSAGQAMSTAGGLNGRGVRLGSRYLAASLCLHIAVIAAAALFFARPPDPPIPIEVSIILETGETEAGQVDAPQAQEQAAQQQAPRPSEVAPRPNPKPVAPLRKTEARKAAPRPSPSKAAPVARQVSPASTENLPVVDQAPAEQLAEAVSPAASNTANDGQRESGTANGTGANTGAGQQAAAPGVGSGVGSGGGSGRAAGGGSKGRGANDYLERVRQALAKHKRYPDQAKKLKQEGTVRISLHLARDGTVLGAQIANGSGFPLLDEAAVQMARDASPVPRVPDDVDGETVRIALPVSFSIGFFGRF
jgi:protein TonB